jgi:hypothetical protein
MAARDPAMTPDSSLEAFMNRKNMSKRDSNKRLALKKELLKDLTPKQTVRGGGFIMKDTVILPRR